MDYTGQKQLQTIELVTYIYETQFREKQYTLKGLAPKKSYLSF